MRKRQRKDATGNLHGPKTQYTHVKCLYREIAAYFCGITLLLVTLTKQNPSYTKDARYIHTIAAYPLVLCQKKEENWQHSSNSVSPSQPTACDPFFSLKPTLSIFFFFTENRNYSKQLALTDPDDAWRTCCEVCFSTFRSTFLMSSLTEAEDAARTCALPSVGGTV